MEQISADRFDGRVDYFGDAAGQRSGVDNLTRLVVVSNRVAAPSARDSRAGGLAVAMRDALGQHGGIWFGWSGDIAKETATAPKTHVTNNITYATVDLSQQDHDQYYLGYANATLWPLLHFRLGLIEYRNAEFEAYMRVNAHFARLLQPLLKPGDRIWVHDYHLIPLAAELRKLGVKNPIGFFLHTPFPPVEVFRALPHYERLLAGFADYDLVGFQTEEAVAAFRSTSAGQTRGGGPRVGAFPIGIDTEKFAQLARRADDSVNTRRLLDSLSGRRLVIGVDRLDYSKGIPNRFDAVCQLLDQSPEWRGKFSYLQITPHSRGEVGPYKELRRELESAAGRINGRFSEFDWTPIRYLNRSFQRQALAGFYRQAAIALVTPFRDGMNLVAKEYVAAQNPDDPGVLVLSSLAGAARELDAALLVNPLDIDEMANAIRRALAMSLEERRERWSRMMAVVSANTISTWRENFLDALTAARKRRRSDAGAGEALSAA
jgi:trehalose 6-phosphate synthase